jgi:glycerophosphoryl diester phosphodiesterase
VSSPAELAPRPLIFAHRGGRALGPENTIVALDIGFAAGADGAEFDVQLSADGRVVVIHDTTLDRTTSGAGAVADRPATDLAALEATRRYGIDLEHQWTGDRSGVPLLDDVLARYPGRPLIIEMKGEDPSLGPAVVSAVRQAGAVARVCLGSFSSTVLAAARHAGPEIPTSASRDESLRALQRSWFYRSPGAVVYRAFQVPERAGRMRVVSRRFVRAVHRSRCAVQVWTVNEEVDMRRLLEYGVDGLITDRPDLAVRVRDAWVVEHEIHARV